MSELKLRRLLEHNARLHEELGRPRIRVSEASQRCVQPRPAPTAAAAVRCAKVTECAISTRLFLVVYCVRPTPDNAVLTFIYEY